MAVGSMNEEINAGQPPKNALATHPPPGCARRLHHPPHAASASSDLLLCVTTTPVESGTAPASNPPDRATPGFSETQHAHAPASATCGWRPAGCRRAGWRAACPPGRVWDRVDHGDGVLVYAVHRSNCGVKLPV